MSDYLPQEVLIKILARLPPVSLIKFRCVSKSWNLLISSPFFISMQTEQAILSKPVDARTEQIIVRRYLKAQNSEVYSVHIDNEDFPDDKNIKIEYPFRDSTRFYYRIVGSYNGVLCLSDDLFGQADSTLLWNPVIKRKVTLPVPQATLDTMGPYMFVLGFGFDVENNDYKLVRMAYVQGDYGYLVPPKVEVYALSIGNWREFSGEVPMNCVVEYFWSDVLISGKVHWVAYRNMGMQEKVENLIMVFNLSSEVFDEMQLPSALENELPINLNAAVLARSLAVIQYDERVWSKSCCIWVMKNYGDRKSWSKQYNIEVDGGLGMVLGFRANGDVLLTARNRGLVSYNPVTGQGRDLGIFGTKDSFYVGTYVESLSLLVEGKEARERIPSDTETETESESECESLVEDDEDQYGDVEKSEFWMQSSMCQYLTVLLKRTFM
ncbi:UNVERIFIED_CONTAM: F-box protein [Sesamum latifolium]|uniref:F-box protein n=1 Tax=Sesamum latifolium TaxID=2727402 RepID=A0AAW2TNK5_9LAMI